MQSDRYYNDADIFKFLENTGGKVIDEQRQFDVRNELYIFIVREARIRQRTEYTN